jgi:hypothetical protein
MGWGRAPNRLLYMQPLIKRLCMLLTQQEVCVARSLRAVGEINHHVHPSHPAYQWHLAPREIPSWLGLHHLPNPSLQLQSHLCPSLLTYYVH